MRLHQISLIWMALGMAAAAQAGPNLVSNGNFEQSSYVLDGNHSAYEFGVDVFNIGITQGVTDWTATLPGGISFYYFPADAATKPAYNRYGDQQATLPLSYPGASPDGGNFIGFDSDFVGDGNGGYNSPLLQTISGLTPGVAYSLTFYWAGTQLQNRHGPTTDKLYYSLGGDTHVTKTVSVANQGFVGWTKVSDKLTATSTTEQLTFLAHGTPAGLPPFVLLDGVSLAVPEPTSWALFGAGFAMVGAAARRRKTFGATGALPSANR